MTAAVHPRSAVVTGLVVVLAYLLLAGAVVLVAGPLASRFGAPAVGAVTALVAVLSYAAAGWAGTRRIRAEGRSRRDTALSAAVGAGLGYAVVPGLVQLVGLVVAGAGLLAVLSGPVLAGLLATAVAAAGAAAGPHAPAPAPYLGV